MPVGRGSARRRRSRSPCRPTSPALSCPRNVGDVMKWMLLLAAVAVPATAQSIYKCRDAKGGAVYQSTPCPEAEKRWDTEPRNYTWEDHYKRQAAEAAIERDRRVVKQRIAARRPVMVGIGGSVSGGTGASIPTVTSSCQSMRDARDRSNERQGHRRTLAGSRIWDDAVWNACK